MYDYAAMRLLPFLIAFWPQAWHTGISDVSITNSDVVDLCISSSWCLGSLWFGVIETRVVCTYSPQTNIWDGHPWSTIVNWRHGGRGVPQECGVNCHPWRNPDLHNMRDDSTHWLALVSAQIHQRKILQLLMEHIYDICISYSPVKFLRPTVCSMIYAITPPVQNTSLIWNDT